MNKRFNLIHAVRVSILVLVVVFSTFSMTKSSSADELTDPYAVTREDMITIADRYVDYRWTGTASNVSHGQGGGVDTPDGSWCLNHTGWCWQLAPVENVGIPYYWGGSTAIGDTDLHLNHTLDGHDTRNFLERIDAGLPAGDINANKAGPQSSTINGVDCVGFINLVWRVGTVGTRFGMSALSSHSRPIRLKDLEMGDILLRSTSTPTFQDPKEHVMLFYSWESVPNFANPVGAKFFAYEASKGPNQVVISEYEITAYDLREDKKAYWENVDQLTIQRRQYCDPDACKVDGSEAIELVYPRSYFKPLDIVLTIDTSGSMGSDAQNLPFIKDAAKLIVDSLREGDKISVVTFTDAADPVYPIQRIDSINDADDEQSDAKTAIDNITPGGNTSIDTGLQEALDQLTNPALPIDPRDDPREDAVRIVILISDGLDGPSSNTVPVVGNLRNANIPVYPIVVSNNGNTNDAFMEVIASHTGGKYIKEPGDPFMLAWRVYTELVMPVRYENPVQAKGRGIPLTGASLLGTSVVEEEILADSSMSSMSIAFFREGNSFDVILKNPDGDVIDITNPQLQFKAGSSYDLYTIKSPQAGSWSMEISGDAGARYAIAVSSESAIILSLETDKEKYLAGEPIKFTAHIQDSVLDTLSDPKAEYIHDASLVLTIETPNQGSPTITLHDDGLNGDEENDDGVYTGIFTDTSVQGSYHFSLSATGETNRDGASFSRETYFSTYINALPEVESIVRTSANPTGYYTVNYKVTFSEDVDGVDVSDFVLTTSGLSSAAVVSVENVERPSLLFDVPSYQYNVSVVTGTGIGTLRLDLIDDDTIVDDGGTPLSAIGVGNGNFTTGMVYDVYRPLSTGMVNQTGDTNDGVCNAHCTLREAVASLVPGDVITFAPELSGATIHLQSPISLEVDMGIDASSLTEPVTISGDGITRIFSITEQDATITLNHLVIADAYLTPSVGWFGGGIYNTSTLTIIDSVFRNNFASSGGALSNASGTLTISNTKFIGNSTIPGQFGAGSGGSGGAIQNNNDGTIIIDGSTFSNNTSNGQFGGAIYNRSGGGSLTIRNSTFSGNSVPANHSAPSIYYGGAIDNGGTMTIVNSTFWGNSVLGNNGHGGAINHKFGDLTLINSTFSDNSAVDGAGIKSEGKVNYANTIIANSTSGSDCALSGLHAAIVTNINNLVDDGTCAASLTGDPKLAPLTDNGGNTWTMALRADSPALNSGDNATCAAAPIYNLDQRGFARPQGAQCDIGAYEKDLGPIPMVDAFEVAPNTTSFNIPVITFYASDDIEVVGYMITESATVPSAEDTGWLADMPTTYSVNAYGSYTLYPWVKDEHGHVSPLVTFPSNVVVTHATATPTPTIIVTSTIIFTPTVTETPELSPTPTVTPTPTLTSTKTLTPTQTYTKTPTVTSTVTETPTVTKTHTTTATVTKTPVSVTFASVATEDGWVLESSENSNVGGSINHDNNTFWLGDDAQDRQYRAIVSFNTNSLPDNATVLSATLRIKSIALVGTNPFSIPWDLWVQIKEGAYNDNAALEMDDFSAAPSTPGSLSGVFNSTPSSGWYSAEIYSSALQYVNQIGTTQFRLRFATDDNDNTTADYLKFLARDFGSDWPELIITYTLP